MNAARFTLNYEDSKTALLKAEAKKQKRNFSQYIQVLFAAYLQQEAPVKKRKIKKRIKNA